MEPTELSFRWFRPAVNPVRPPQPEPLVPGYRSAPLGGGQTGFNFEKPPTAKGGAGTGFSNWVQF